jgi:coenzyme Q-binding protein COQ10
MLKHIEQKKLPYSRQQLFDLVADVARYKEFLPWCVASRINRWEGDDIFYADLVVGYKMIRERFSSKVHLENPDHIYIEYIRGPMKHLKNHWRFIAEEDGGCTIDFSVEFEFSNNMLQGLARMFFNEVIKRMVSAFEARAAEIYSSESVSPLK